MTEEQGFAKLGPQRLHDRLVVQVQAGDEENAPAEVKASVSGKASAPMMLLLRRKAIERAVRLHETHSGQRQDHPTS